MLADATIEILDSRVNGYDVGLGEGDSVLGGAETLASEPVCQQAREGESGAPAAQIKSDDTVHGESKTDTEGRATPQQKKPAVKSQPKVKTPSSKTSARIRSSEPGVTYVPQSALDRDLAKLETMSRAALAGSTKALDELRIALDRCPHIWRRLADLEQLVELKLITLVAGNDPLRSEAFRKRCAELRHHLLDGEPSSLATKMAASRLTITWLFVQFLELRALESPGPFPFPCWGNCLQFGECNGLFSTITEV